MYVVFCKIDHCIHTHWCIPMGLGHNEPWVESHMWPQQTWGQSSSKGLILQWLQKYMIAKAGDSWFENRLVFMEIKLKLETYTLWPDKIEGSLQSLHRYSSSDHASPRIALKERKNGQLGSGIEKFCVLLSLTIQRLSQNWLFIMEGRAQNLRILLSRNRRNKYVEYWPQTNQITQHVYYSVNIRFICEQSCCNKGVNKIYKNIITSFHY